jgi:hypothetical protein
MIQVNWQKCNPNSWCDLINLNLSHKHFENLYGVYIIRHWWENPKTVRVWQGNIAERLQQHRTDKDILNYKQYWLFVTWAPVSESIINWVERFLWDSLSPLIWERFPYEISTEVNLPW